MNAIIVFIVRLLIILLTYTFVGWITFVIYTDLRGSSLEKGKTPVTPITLIASIDQEKTTRHFTIPEIIIGRDPACNFPLDDVTISARHCKLSFHHNQWWAEDLGSTNGSYLNDTLIETAVVLADGDDLQLGQIHTSIQIN